MSGQGFHCGTCGQWHAGLPMDVGYAEPWQIGDLVDGKYPEGASADGDFRTTRHDDGEIAYFIRGVLELPVRDTDETFVYGVWASLSEASMREARRADSANEAAGPFFGWLCNRIPGYPDTLNLKTNVHILPDRVARIELEPTDHPLAVEQREGISRQRIIEIVTPLLHTPSTRPATTTGS